MSNNPFPYSAGSQIQPYTSSLEAVAAQDSTAIFTGPLTPPGQTFTVTIQCSSAANGQFVPDTAQFTAEINGAPVGQFRAGNTYGPLPIQAGNQLIVNAVGLIPGQTYFMNLTGIAYTSVINLPAYPSAYSDSITEATEQIYLGSGTYTTGGSFFTVTVQSLWRTVYLITTGQVTVTAVGSQSGISYPAYSDSSWVSSSSNLFRVPIVQGPDSSITLTVKGTSSGGSVWYGADLAIQSVSINTSNSQVTTVPLSVSESSLLTLATNGSGDGFIFSLTRSSYLLSLAFVNKDPSETAYVSMYGPYGGFPFYSWEIPPLSDPTTIPATQLPKPVTYQLDPIYFPLNTGPTFYASYVSAPTQPVEVLIMYSFGN